MQVSWSPSRCRSSEPDERQEETQKAGDDDRKRSPGIASARLLSLARAWGEATRNSLLAGWPLFLTKSL